MLMSKPKSLCPHKELDSPFKRWVSNNFEYLIIAIFILGVLVFVLLILSIFAGTSCLESGQYYNYLTSSTVCS